MSDSASSEARLNVQVVADAITAEAHFARNSGGRLHVYRDGVWRPDGESFVRECVKSIYREARQGGRWSLHRSNEVVEYIRVDCQILWDVPPHDTINVLNGLVDVSTRQIRLHSPEFLSSIQIPVQFDPDANCRAWDKFVADVFPEDARAIAWELLGWLLTPEKSIQKAILLLGEGSNGKSTFLRGAVNFIGKSNTAALSLHKIEQDRFAASRLVGKLANICPDLPTSHLSSTMTFKALTGGDVLSAEYKFKDIFEYVPYCKLVFSANKPPASDDNTHGFFRRWLVVPFTRCFEEGLPVTLSREKLDTILSRPQELSGVLNKALLTIPQIREKGLRKAIQ